MPIVHDQDYLDFCRGELQDRFSIYRRLREEDPVHWSEPLNNWILTRYRDVYPTLRNTTEFSVNSFQYKFEKYLPAEMQIRLKPLLDHLSKWLVVCDPPVHTRLRKLVGKAFAPKVVSDMEAQIDSLIDELLAPLEAGKPFDLIREFAYPLPATIISRILGIPESDKDFFFGRSADLFAFTGGAGLVLPEVAPKAHESLAEIVEYLNGLFHERRRSPREDLIGMMLAVEEEGDRLDPEELTSMCVMLLVAGHDTTTNLITSGMLALLDNPAELSRLRERPELVDSAIEEMLRYYSPLQRQTRIALTDLEIDGHAIRKGQGVLAMAGAANRDPEFFPDPDRFDIARENNRHLAFGSGIHFCLGAPLARLEGRKAINELIRRFPNMKLAHRDLKWRTNMTLLGLESLWIDPGAPTT